MAGGIMNKILVRFLIPATGDCFDVFIPDFMPVKTICSLLGKAIDGMTEAEYKSSGQEVLCSVETQQILNPEQSLAEYGVCNGDTLIFC